MNLEHRRSALALRSTHALLLPCALLCFAGCASGGDRYAFSGTLQSERAAIGSTIGGRVTSVLVHDGAAVRRGDVLLRFDDRQQRAALQSALGRVAQARASLADLAAGTRAPDLARAQALASQQQAAYDSARLAQPREIAVLRLQLREARAQAADAAAAARQAQLDAHRSRSLYASGDVSAQERDAAVAREERAAAQVANAAAVVRAARDQLANGRDVTLPRGTAAALASYRAAEEAYRSLAVGARPDQVRAAQASLDSAQGDVAAARARLDETVVRAPAAGVVSDTNLHAGDLVAAGAAVATIDERDEPYVRIYVPQSMLDRLRVGARLDARSDAVPNATFSATVEQIDTQAQFTPQNVQTASDRATLSFGVKLRVHDTQNRLHGGTTLEVALP